MKCHSGSADRQFHGESGSVERAFDWGSKGCWFESHHRQSTMLFHLARHFIHCLVLVLPGKIRPNCWPRHNQTKQTYSKNCLKRPLKNRQNTDLHDKWFWMKVKSILQYFWPALSENRSENPIFGCFLLYMAFFFTVYGISAWSSLLPKYMSRRFQDILFESRLAVNKVPGSHVSLRLCIAVQSVFFQFLLPYSRKQS